MNQTFKNNIFMIAGPAGELEACLHLATLAENKKLIAVVCHPHPLYQGTMNNKVITTLARTLCDFGCNTLRFNFRGVGKSGGQYDNGIGETEDLLAAVYWLQQRFLNHELILSGFSFGSFVVARAALQMKVTKLILVAPAVNHADFANLAEFSCSWIVVQGDQDEIVPAAEVIAWCKTRKNQPQLLVFQGTSHFFHGKLMELKEKLLKALCA